MTTSPRRTLKTWVDPSGMRKTRAPRFCHVRPGTSRDIDETYDLLLQLIVLLIPVFLAQVRRRPDNVCASRGEIRVVIGRVVARVTIIV